MADIKTRDVSRGTVKTLDRAASSMHRIKEETIKSKSTEIGGRNDNESAASYSYETTEQYAGSSAVFAARTGADLMMKSKDSSSQKAGVINDHGQPGVTDAADMPDAANMTDNNSRLANIANNHEEFANMASRSEEMTQTAFREYGRKSILERQEKARLADAEAIQDAGRNRMPESFVRASGKDTEMQNSLRIGRAHTGGKTPFAGKRTVSAGKRIDTVTPANSLIQRKRKEYAIRRIRENNSGTGVLRILPVTDGGKSVSKSSDRMRRIFKRIADSSKALITALSAGGTLALLIVVVLIICGGTFALLGDEDGNDFAFDFYGIGYGDTAIVRVAEAEIGNVGGDKYWKWYGFESHVHWCACFVSWCANECGYIKEDIIPKFAVVGNGAKWFKDKGQWASRDYEPKAGDIIFFDYERDGVLDHVGIVEDCDGKTVTTIEGNSSNTCRRCSYKKGSKQIVGYGVPMYGLLFDPGDMTLIQANMVAWATKIAADNTYSYKNWIPGNANTHKCPICHPGSGNGWNCIGFAFACWHHGGGLRSRCNCGVISDDVWNRILNAKSDAQAIRIASDRIGVPVIVIRNNGNIVPQSKIRAGDICGCFMGRSYYHTTFSIGNGEIIHCTSSGSAAQQISKRSAIGCKVVIRYAGMK